MFTFREFLLAENKSPRENKSRYDKEADKYDESRKNPRTLSAAERKQEQRLNDEAIAAAERADAERFDRDEQSK